VGKRWDMGFQHDKGISIGEWCYQWQLQGAVYKRQIVKVIRSISLMQRHLAELAGHRDMLLRACEHY